MRTLVVIPHYFGPSHPNNNLPTIGSYIEPLGRIAALSDAIVSLHRHFGPIRHFFDGTAIAADQRGADSRLDIVVLALRGFELADYLGLTPGTIEVEYLECEPPRIAFEAQRIFRERLGRYDFYCFMEDDLVIHDPAFFDKLTWFQEKFGHKTLLMPVRCEVPATGTPAKVIADVDLPEVWYRPFRRGGQRETLEGVWNGRTQAFHLPKNPHAGAFFLTAAQMDHWARQPTFDDRDASWAGPIESAGTLSVGRVFDLYKPGSPDPFFLEVQHSGVRYSSRAPPEGRRYGEPPLLAIAQNALRLALGNQPGVQAAADRLDPAFARLVGLWLAQGTAVELRAQLDVLQEQTETQNQELAVGVGENSVLKRFIADLQNTMAERDRQLKDVESRHRELVELLAVREREFASQLAARQREAEAHLAACEREASARLDAHKREASARHVAFEREIVEKRRQQLMQSRSFRWLLGSIRAEARRRWGTRTER
jgi:hypothetical protein